MIVEKHCLARWQDLPEAPLDVVFERARRSGMEIDNLVVQDRDLRPPGPQELPEA